MANVRKAQFIRGIVPLTLRASKTPLALNPQVYDGDVMGTSTGFEADGLDQMTMGPADFYNFSNAGIYVSNCQGPTLITNCDFANIFDPKDPADEPRRVRFRQSIAISLVNCFGVQIKDISIDKFHGGAWLNGCHRATINNLRVIRLCISHTQGANFWTLC